MPRTPRTDRSQNPACRALRTHAISESALDTQPLAPVKSQRPVVKPVKPVQPRPKRLECCVRDLPGIDDLVGLFRKSWDSCYHCPGQ